MHEDRTLKDITAPGADNDVRGNPGRMADARELVSDDEGHSKCGYDWAHDEHFPVMDASFAELSLRNSNSRNAGLHIEQILNAYDKYILIL